MKSRFQFATAGIATLLLLFIAFAMCEKSQTAPPASSNTNQVVMQNTAFSPISITVALNTTVTWTNKDGFAHTVTSDNGIFDSGTVNSNGTFSFKFTSVGTFT